MGFLVFLGISGSFFVTTLASAFRYLIKARTLGDMPTSKARSAEQGYVELEGHAELLDGPPIHAPLSARECVWWSYTVSEKRGDSWKVIDKKASDSLFAIVDATGKCIVDPEGAYVYPEHKRTWKNDKLLKVRYGGVTFDSNQRYTEHYLLPHELITVIGQYRTHSAIDNWDDSEELRSILALWKKDQPALLARFDENSDGKIDQAEWQAAREAARAELDDQKRELAVRPGVNVIGAPDDRRPFLIAPLRNNEFVQKLRWKAFWSFCGMVVAGGFLIFVLVSRFSP